MFFNVPVPVVGVVVVVPVDDVWMMINLTCLLDLFLDHLDKLLDFVFAKSGLGLQVLDGQSGIARAC